MAALLAQHGPGQRDPAPGVVVVADDQVGVTFEHVRRLRGHDVDHAADGVDSEQRPLRPAQYLDALDVEEIELRLGVVAEEHLIDVEADGGGRGSRAAGGLDPSDVGEAELEVGAGRVLEVRRTLGDVVELGHDHVVERLLGEGGDGDRDVLELLFTLLGGDRDLFLDRLDRLLGWRRLWGRCRLLAQRDAHQSHGQPETGKHSAKGGALGLHATVLQIGKVISQSHTLPVDVKHVRRVRW